MEPIDPAAWQPRLTLWGHVWRLIAMLAISAIAWVEVVEREQEVGDWLVLLDLVVGALTYVLVFWRRRWPVAVALGTALAAPISAVAAGPGILALTSLATRRRARETGVVAAITFTCWLAFELLTRNPDPPWVVVTTNVIALAAVVGWGQYLGSRRELLYTLRQRAERAEAERDARAREARATERERIAREMHDVLAHRISQIAMHAGAVTYRDDLTAEELRGSVAVIRQQAHEALTDLRGVLGVLRDADGAVIRPQPTYRDLPTLIDEARSTGTRIEYDDWVTEAQTMPDGVGRTVYRIVQEGITNARKHAPGATLRIRLAGNPEGGVELVLRNPLGFGPPRTPGSGLGLIGLTERAEQGGGRLDHGVDPDGNGSVFAVTAWLPWST